MSRIFCSKCRWYSFTGIVTVDSDIELIILRFEVIHTPTFGYTINNFTLIHTQWTDATPWGSAQDGIAIENLFEMKSDSLMNLTQWKVDKFILKS